MDSGSTTTIVDADTALPGATADHYDFAHAKIVTTPTGAAPQGQVRRVIEGGYGPSTGTFTIGPALTGATGAADTYEIWPDWDPGGVDLIINEKLRELHMPAFFPLTLDLLTSDNNDFEQTIATNTIPGLTRQGSATAANSTSIIYNGARSAQITVPTPASDYYYNLLSVDGGKAYYSAVVAACNTGDQAKFLINDATNSATIDQATTAVSSNQPVALVIPWSAPSTCRRVTVQFMGVTASDITYWDDYQTWSVSPYIYQLPSWITRKEQLIDVVAFPPGTGSLSDSDYRVNEYGSRKLPFRFERADTRATNELFIYVETYSNWRPYILAYRPLDEVSADYVTTTANTVPLSSTEADGLVLGVLAEMHREMADATVGEKRALHEREAMLLDRQYASAVRHLRPESREERIQHRRVYGGVA